MNGNVQVREYIHDLVETLKREYQPERIILFGSYAYGQPDENSDVDLFIVKETDAQRDERARQVHQLASTLKRRVPVEALVYTPQELRRSCETGDPLLRVILEQGEELYESDAFKEGELHAMKPADSLVPQEWFERADEDLLAATVLLNTGNAFSIAAFHIQQAVEKYLKGYLLKQGWTLQRTHDLEVLLSESIHFDKDFVPHMSACQRINQYYTEQRYPVIAATKLAADAVREALNDAQALIDLIRRKLQPGNSSLRFIPLRGHE